MANIPTDLPDPKAVEQAAIYELKRMGIEPTNEELERIVKGSLDVKSFAWNLIFLKQERDKNLPGGAGASPAEFAGSRSVKQHPESPGAEQ